MFASYLHILKRDGNASGVGEDLNDLELECSKDHLAVDLDECRENLYIS